MTNRRRVVAIAATVIATVALAGCGSGTENDASGSEPTKTTPGAAEIVAFDVPTTTACAESATFTTVAVSYETAGAARTELRVDGRSMELDDPRSGTVSADIRCDPLPHDFVLIAYDDDELLTVEQRMLNTTR